MTDLRVLLVEDCDDDVALLLRTLKSAGYEINFLQVQDQQAMLEALNQTWDIVISDYNLPNFDAPAALETVKAKEIDTPFIVVSGTVGEDAAVKTMRAGASDYINKDNLSRLVPAIERELREARTRAELKAAQSRLNLSQRLESVGRLAGGVAHDFNNLLTAITGYTDLLLDRLSENSNAYDDIMEIKKAAARAAALTGQLLAFSRQQVLQPRILDINAILKDFERMLRRLVGEDIQLIFDLRSPHANIKADPSQMEQVIMNLVVNARDAMTKGGRLVIETSDITLTEEYANNHLAVMPGRYVMLAISDSGSGISKDILPHIFEPFFTTKAQGEGLGLGLATVYGIVKQSGGNIWVYSEPGKGTTFKLYFPKVDEKPDAQNTVEAKPRSLKGNEAILVVEDEDVVRRLVCQILRKHGYRIVEARNGEEALAVARSSESTFDLVLTDVIMPQMSGKEMVDALTTHLGPVKVLYMSGYTDRGIVLQGILETGTAFLQKPFTPDKLAAKVREVLESKA